jgi:hypothetical protein
MMDESHSEERPLEAPAAVAELRREVEPPRTAAGLWMPFMALASAAMLTIVSGVAVMTRAPRAQLVAPVEDEAVKGQALSPAELADIERRIEVISRRVEASRARSEARTELQREQNRVMCRAPVHRGDVDGREQPYDECIVPADLKAKAQAQAKGPAVR